MSRRPRRNHTAAFKAKVALEALRGTKTAYDGEMYERISLCKIVMGRLYPTPDYQRFLNTRKQLNAFDELMRDGREMLFGVAKDHLIEGVFGEHIGGIASILGSG